MWPNDDNLAPDWITNLETRSANNDPSLELANELQQRQHQPQRPLPDRAFKAGLRQDLLRQYNGRSRWGWDIWQQQAGGFVAIGVLAAAVFMLWLTFANPGPEIEPDVFGQGRRATHTPTLTATVPAQTESGPILATPTPFSPTMTPAGTAASETAVGETNITTNQTIPTRTPLAPTDGDVILLNAYRLDAAQFTPGLPFSVTLQWDVLTNIQQEWWVYLHLIDNSETIYAQSDGPPLQGERPTSTWQVGEMISDTHTIAIPASLPPGDYHLRVGLYNAVTQERAGYMVNGVLLQPVLVFNEVTAVPTP